MYAIRRFEERIMQMFLRGEVPGTTHLCNGQEAVSVGVSLAMNEDDVFSGTYRGHGHILARGADEFRVAAELFGRADGLCGGRAGSLNLFDVSRHYIGSFAIIGGSIGAGTGVALALKDSARVCVASFGDGATNQGYFFECLNFAAIQNLPLVLLLENNGYMEYTPIENVTANSDSLPGRAAVFGIPTETVDGMDVDIVYRAATRAIERARAGGGPQLVECKTYRFVGHSRTDPGAYRPEGELEKWMERDPLLISRQRLSAEFDVEAPRLDEEEAVVEDRLSDVFDRALASPFPSADGDGVVS